MKALTIFVVTLIVGIVGGIALAPKVQMLVPGFGNNQPGITATSVRVSGPTVINSIEQGAKLETVSMNIAKDMTVRRAHGLRNVCKEDVTYLSYFDVTAGIDLAKITMNNIQVTNDGFPTEATVTIILPPAQIMHNELDMNNSRILAENYPQWLPGCNHQTASMVIEAQTETQKSAGIAAIEKGILQIAEKQAALELEKLLINAGYTHVTITYSSK